MIKCGKIFNHIDQPDELDMCKSLGIFCTRSRMKNITQPATKNNKIEWYLMIDLYSNVLSLIVWMSWKLCRWNELRQNEPEMYSNSVITFDIQRT